MTATTTPITSPTHHQGKSTFRRNQVRPPPVSAKAPSAHPAPTKSTPGPSEYWSIVNWRDRCRNRSVQSWEMILVSSLAAIATTY